MRRRKTHDEPTDICPLCERTRQLTFHHLIPRAMHRRKWCKKRFTLDERNTGVYLCVDCHSAVHRFVSEQELARNYNTVEDLRNHPQVARFVAWASKQRGHRSRTRTWGGRV